MGLKITRRRAGGERGPCCQNENQISTGKRGGRTSSDTSPISPTLSTAVGRWGAGEEPQSTQTKWGIKREKGEQGSPKKHWTRIGGKFYENVKFAADELCINVSSAFKDTEKIVKKPSRSGKPLPAVRWPF